MNFSINSNGIEILLQYLLKSRPIKDDDMRSIINGAIQWHDKIICLAYSLARVLERDREDFLNNREYIKKMFSLPDEMYIEIKECDEDFIHYMLQNKHPEKIINLEATLLDVTNRQLEHHYDKNTLRN